MMTEQKTKNWFVKTGDFFFKWRNYVFPVIVVGLVASFRPPAAYNGSTEIVVLKDIIAFLLIFGGLAFRTATIGWAYIKRGGLNKQVYADTLVVSGFFGLCRNPLYVGNLSLYAGLFILHGHPAVMVLGIGLYYFIYESIVAAEEYFLVGKFGDEFLAYCARVPRWFPKFSLYKQVTEGMSFSVTRSITKDYTTISNTLFGVIIIELMKSYYNGSRDDFSNTAQICAICAAVLILCVARIKMLKKSGRFAKV